MSNPHTSIVIRIYFKQLGGHVHCRVFTAKSRDHTFGKCGDLVLSEEEWPAFQALMARSKQVELILEDLAGSGRCSHVEESGKAIRQCTRDANHTDGQHFMGPWRLK